MPSGPAQLPDVYDAPDCLPLEVLYGIEDSAPTRAPLAVPSAKAVTTPASYEDLYSSPGCVATETLYAALDEPAYTARPLGHMSVHGVVVLPGVAPLGAKGALAAVDDCGVPGTAAVTLGCKPDAESALEQPLGQYSVHGLLVNLPKRTRVSCSSFVLFLGCAAILSLSVAEVASHVNP